MEHIKNIILDLGGVLINLDFQKLNESLKRLGLENAFSKTEQIELFDKLEEGKISEDFFLSEFKNLTTKKHSNKEIIDAWNSILLDLPIERIELLEHLGKKYRLFLFSNTNAMHIKEVYSILNRTYGIKNLNPYFEKIYLSNELGIRKPKVEGFKQIIASHDLKLNETLFIDDSPQHVSGAKEAGLQAQLLDLEKEDINNLVKRLSLI
ncbi:MAG: haloacid dehalogenase [Flavobacteriales bacterium]|nr:haloacid dehalogenase [Flavobacteriales bacterium]